MRLNLLHSCFLLIASGLLLCGGLSCSTESDPESGSALTSVENGGIGKRESGGSTVQISFSGDLRADPTTLRGRNDSRVVDAEGDIMMALFLDMAALSCPEKPGTIPWEPGLVAFVQSNTPRVGTLGLHYDKSGSTVQGSVDSWTTRIGDYNYVFNVFRWTSVTHTEQADGSTLIQYRGASVEVFKKKGGRIVSREQCFGPYADYDVLVK